jgi:SAM-dependent methyltransferase
VSGSGRALDIGCGGGEFLSELRKQGWSVYGMEINTHIATFAHNQRGIDMIAGDAHELAYAKNTFDLITLWDTLEHFKDPRRALNDASLVARPSALLVVSTPNPDSLEARWFGPYWAGWDIPRHLNLFSRSTLTWMIEEEGWSVQEVRYFRGRHWLLAHSLRFWLQDKRLPQILYKFSVAFINSRLMQALSLPFFMVVERLKLGSIMVFFARRKGADHA